MQNIKGGRRKGGVRYAPSGSQITLLSSSYDVNWASNDEAATISNELVSKTTLEYCRDLGMVRFGRAVSSDMSGSHSN